MVTHHELRGPEDFPMERAPTMGEITMEAYIADMRDEVQAAVADGLLEVRPAEEAP